MINVLAELEYFKIEYDWAGENEVEVCCPFHGDSNPSCNINIEKRNFHCKTAGCGESGDIIKILAKFANTTRSVILEQLSSRYDLSKVKIIDTQVIERYHSRIWEAKPLLKELYNRKVTDEDIRRYRLGVDRGRITIPIKNESGLYINVRRYLPGAPGPQKMKNTRNKGAMSWYPIDQLQYDELVLTGGEMKAIVAARELNPHGIGAITATGGEEALTLALLEKLFGKKIWIINDIDEAGQKSAKKRCALLKKKVSYVSNIVLPLDIEKYPTGDINDYKAEGKDLLPLLQNSEEWCAEAVANDYSTTEEPQEVNLTSAVNSKYARQRIVLKSTVSAMDTAPFSIPKKGHVICGQDQKCCVDCPVFQNEDTEFSIPPEDPAVLEMVNKSNARQRDAIITSMKIPQNCRTCSFESTEFYNVEDVRVSPQLEVSNRNSDRVMQPAICVGDGMELNESYEMIGRMHPHPETQQATLLISRYEPTQDALSTFQLDDPSELNIFQPKKWSLEGLEAILNDIYSDIETNITRICQRRSIHLVTDLAYHSPLFIKFDGRRIKGWVESLIVGDSAQGKTDTVLHLMEHYGLGEKVECKNATVAGLLGGLQQSGNRWFATWGVIPTHDMRLVILEELKGAETYVISKLTDMRSSGFAEIPKIEKRKTHARTRIVALSNPRSNRPLHEYSFGIEAIRELIGSLEDVRRFDIFSLVSAKEIDPEEINNFVKNRPKIEHKYSSSLCRKLILWAWTSKEATFTKEAENKVVEGATILSKEFTDAIPIFDRGSGRLRLARVAAALAARTFSHDEEHNVLVRECHVQYMIRYMLKAYSSPVFGYSDYTKAKRVSESITDTKLIRKQIQSCPFPHDFVTNILHAHYIDLQDIQDWCGWDRTEAQVLLSLLVRKRCIIRERRKYRKTSSFIEFLKELKDDPDFKDRPEFMPEAF